MTRMRLCPATAVVPYLEVPVPPPFHRLALLEVAIATPCAPDFPLTFFPPSSSLTMTSSFCSAAVRHDEDAAVLRDCGFPLP